MSKPRIAGACLFIVVVALLVRGLYLADGIALLYTPEQDGTRMARRYDESAVAMLQGEGILFPRVWNPLHTGLASRPPGYPMFLASVYATVGRSFPLVAAAQDVLTSLAALLVFAFTFGRFGLGSAFVAGLLVAVSPHLAATSNLILADAVAQIPLLLAFLLAVPVIARDGSLKRDVACLSGMGLLIGAGVWLRPNVMLLGPFAAFFLFFLLGRTKRAFGLSTLVAVTSLAVIAPITLRNWLVFGEFVPVSINGGITLWQGVADAGGKEYGARVWDKQVMAEEAQRYGRPDYLLWWAEPEGIARDHDRYRRATAVIKARPFWYAKAMARRIVDMLLFVDGPRALMPSGVVVKGLREERVPLDPAPGLDAQLDETAFAKKVGVASFLRGPLRLVHGVWFFVPLFVWIGVILGLRRDPRVTALWLIVPLYYLIFESPFLYEWRVAVPMQYFLLPFAALALTTAEQRIARMISSAGR